MNKKKLRYVAVNILLFAFLYLSVTFNKEYIRPGYGSTPFIGILTGSYSNFMAAYIISLFALTPIMVRNLALKKGRMIFYTVAVLVFLILTVEEIKPFTDASKTYDIYDIIASGLGSLLAIITFEVIMRLRGRPENV